MKTIICKLTKEEFYGNVIESPRTIVNNCGELIQHWTFETKILNDKYDINGSCIIWECMSDYWELIDSDLRKVEMALRIDEEDSSGIINKLKKILKWGHCNG